jgi:hypothetical protein
MPFSMDSRLQLRLKNETCHSKVVKPFFVKAPAPKPPKEGFNTKSICF